MKQELRQFSGKLLFLAFTALGQQLCAQQQAPAQNPKHPPHLATNNSATIQGQSYSALYNDLHQKLTKDNTKEIGMWPNRVITVIDSRPDIASGRPSFVSFDQKSLVASSVVAASEKVFGSNQKLKLSTKDPNAIPKITYVAQATDASYTHEVLYNKKTHILLDYEPDFKNGGIVVDPAQKTVTLNRKENGPITYIMNGDSLPNTSNRQECYTFVKEIFPQIKDAALLRSKDGKTFTITGGQFNMHQDKIDFVRQHMAEKPEEGEDYVKVQNTNGTEIRLFVENPKVLPGQTRYVNLDHSSATKLLFVMPTSLALDSPAFDGHPNQSLTTHFGKPNGTTYTATGNSLAADQNNKIVIAAITPGVGNIHLDDVLEQKGLDLTFCMMPEIGGLRFPDPNTAMFLDKKGRALDINFIGKKPWVQVKNKDGSIDLMNDGKLLKLTDAAGHPFKLSPDKAFNSKNHVADADRPSLEETADMFGKILQIPDRMGEKNNLAAEFKGNMPSNPLVTPAVYKAAQPGAKQ